MNFIVLFVGGLIVAALQDMGYEHDHLLLKFLGNALLMFMGILIGKGVL